MGGSLAVHLVHENLLPNVMSFAVIDVVEGSAMAALNSMTSFLRSRPQSFGSMEKAISWCLKSGTTKNLRAARVSMPSQIVARTGADGQQVFVNFLENSSIKKLILILKSRFKIVNFGAFSKLKIFSSSHYNNF